MHRTPSAVWIVDTNKEHLAVDEARKLGIPIIAILDTNCDPDQVNYPVPGNDDSIRSVGLLTRVIADAVAEGLITRHGVDEGGEKNVSAVEPMPEWERELLEGSSDEAPAAEAATPAAETPAAEAPAAEAPAAEAAEAPAAEATTEAAAADAESTEA